MPSREQMERGESRETGGEGGVAQDRPPWLFIIRNEKVIPPHGVIREEGARSEDGELNVVAKYHKTPYHNVPH